MSTHFGGTSRLTYGLATVPAPLATDRSAHIDIVVSNSGTEAVLCKQILVVLPTGDLAQDLVPAGHRVVPTVEPVDQWTVDEIESGVLLTLPQDDMAAFTAGGTPLTVRPASGESVSLTTHGLLLRLKDFKANGLAGTALLRVRETVSVDNGQTWETNQVVLPVAKYPAVEALTADVVGDLVLREADINGNPGSVPVTLLAPGQKAILTWAAPSDAICDVYFDGRHAGPLTGQEKWQFPVTGLTRDTHFHVQVTLKRSGDTITQHLSTAVAVAKPVLEQLTVTQLTAVKITSGGRTNNDGHQLLTIEGAVEVDKESHFHGNVYGGNGTLIVGDAVVAKKSLSAEEQVTVTGSLTAQTVKARDEVLGKKLAVTEKALVGSTNFSGMDNGDLWISGKFSANRADLNTLLGTPDKLTGAFNGTERTAPSHGLLLLWIKTVGHHATRTVYVDINTGGENFETVAAASIDYGNAPDVWGASATVPLRKGQRYKIWQEGEGGTTDAYFFPVLSG
ncbi:hypothetical protein EKH77_00155 [Streptomyces luteoverticillatus]|uniref:Uncharacterized protein n=1 Tax=Streptomyces luteoverticillatus TaxID=66425 RepID=A0A3S9PBS0_STRLT|nr:hypothetical protein [Streptomyces luteoverticillatus]AZQ69845.1 hypothetical protein EKH77_00155 [Streptomyces luteoverticillatus]